MKKTLFITSSLNTTKDTEAGKIAQKITNTYQLLDNLKKHWTKSAKVLMISSNPITYEINDFYANIYRQSFSLSKLPINKIDIYDNRNSYNLLDYDVLLLAGGHTPTQNNYFNDINLKNLLEPYQGLIIGISAGSMNSADIVYAAPELENEATDKSFKRYLPGLSLFPHRIIPHFDELKDSILDGLHFVDEILIPDSYNYDFFALDDDSYFIKHNNQIELFGRTSYFLNGKIKYINNTTDLI